MPDDLTLTKLLGAKLAARVKRKYPHCRDGLLYALDVVSGREVAGRLAILACQRQLDDLAAWLSGDRSDWRFDWDKGESICRFIEELRHVKGVWANKRLTIKLRPWQQFNLTVPYGWYADHPYKCLQCDTEHDGPADLCAECGEDAVSGGWHRRFRVIYGEVARKNAKTTIGSGQMLYALTKEGEQGAEVYSAATGSDQARISFDIARQQAMKDPEFSDFYGVDIRAHNLIVLDTGSKLEPLSSETKGLDGKNPSLALIDEYHAHLDNGVVSSLETGMGSREQPLLVYVTTAGFNRAGPCYAMRSKAVKVLQGALVDDQLFAIIHTVDEDDDPLHDPSCWRKANPNFGVSVFPAYLEGKVNDALADPVKQTHVLTKNFNQWLSAESRLFNMVKWDKCGEPFDVERFVGVPCWVGVDLASREDIAVLSMNWEIDGHWFVKNRYYLPEAVVLEGAHSSHAHYRAWAFEGLLTLTKDEDGGPGYIINFDEIMADLVNLPTLGVAVQEIAFDPWRAVEMVTKLNNLGITAVEVRNTAGNLSEPLQDMLARVANRTFHHGGDKVMTWGASNVVGHYDNKDNVYPKKERRSEKIDPIMAPLFARNRMIRHQAAPVSQYGRGAKMVTSAGGKEDA